MRIKIILLCSVLSFTSCIKEVDFNVDTVPQKLVVNSVITVYQPIEVNVSGLQSILDTSQLFIDNATVIVCEEGGDTDTLSYLSNGNYKSNIYGEPGKVYRLTVQAKGYPTAFACDTIPVRINIKNASERKSATVDEDGIQHEDLTVTFLRSAEKTNYYELFFVEQDADIIDSTTYYYFNFTSDAVSIDPIILASGTTDYNYATFLFNDANIAAEEYTIAMKMHGYISAGGGGYTKPIITLQDNIHAAVLRTVSKAYYDYRNSWDKHQRFKNDSTKVEDIIYVPLIGEPQEMFSNIENGLGIFVAYNQDFFTL